MKAQLSLDGPFPATPQERERAVLAAFGARSPAKVVSMRAARYSCPWTSCTASVGDQCTRPSRGRHVWLLFPHSARVELTEVCAEHGTPKGQSCAGLPVGECLTRRGQVAELVALGAASTVVDERVDTSMWPEVLVSEDEQGLYPLTPPKSG